MNDIPIEPFQSALVAKARCMVMEEDADIIHVSNIKRILFSRSMAVHRHKNLVTTDVSKYSCLIW
jgi:hypothetical protein